MNRCETCKFWDKAPPFHRHPGIGGWCQSSKLREPLSGDTIEYGEDELVYSYDEGGSFWTGPKFGCVHHEGSE